MSQGLIIQRSRSQLLTSYAPGTYFTFEGGSGACKVYPSDKARKSRVEDETKKQILERIRETAQSWLQRARQAERNPDRPIRPETCVHENLLSASRDGIILSPEAKMVLMTPNFMDYRPAPLTMVCDECGLVRSYDNLKQLHQDLDLLQGGSCPHPRRTRPCGHQGNENLPCNWRQLDVMFIHWSGNVEGAMPHRYNWNRQARRVCRNDYSCICGCSQAELNRKPARVGHWHFVCANCGNPDSRWLQNDPVTMRMFKNETPDRIKEVRMEPISCRANSVTYPMMDRIIDFSGHNILRLIGSNDALFELLAETFGYPRQEIDLSEIEYRLKSYPEEMEKLEKKYKKAKKEYNAIKDDSDKQWLIDILKKELDDIEGDWRAKGYIRSPIDVPDGIRQMMAISEDMPSKFKPFRLFAEHTALKRERLDAGIMSGDKNHFVPFDNPDADLVHEPLKNKGDQVRQKLGRIGISKMGLIRKFQLCFYSFGYSRRSPTPIFTNNNRQVVPAKLCLYDKIDVEETSKKHPVYVLKQENEAIYVQLNHETVRDFIIDLGCDNAEAFRTGALGSRILENVFPMSMFLDNLPNGEERPHPYLAVYTLLHTMAHHLIHAVSEYSGLDLGSLGEYIFPADLAFVVYRNGMTMDLGNLSAMWRNQGRAFLNHLTDPKSLSCGLGMLCSNRDGACPDCIMVPEVTCIAQNKLLSRSILIGEGKPRDGGFTTRIDGYFRTVRNRAQNQAANP